MEELAFRFRRAEPEDARALRAAKKSTLSHPDGPGRSESFKGAIDRGELLLLERYEPREKDWSIGGFVDYHLFPASSWTARNIAARPGTTSGPGPASGRNESVGGPAEVCAAAEM